MRAATKKSADKTPRHAIYGINHQSRELERVLVDSSGQLTKIERDGSRSIHKVAAGKDVETEIRSFYNLTDLVWLPYGPRLEAHPEVLRLGRKAAELQRSNEVSKASR